MNYEPNTRHWQIGDIVIHDADAKQADMLMRVTGYDPKTGKCKTRYITPEAFGWPKNRVCLNWPEVLHDPARFGLETQAQPDTQRTA